MSTTNSNSIYDDYIKNLKISYSAKSSEEIKLSEKALEELEKEINLSFVST